MHTNEPTNPNPNPNDDLQGILDRFFARTASGITPGLGTVTRLLSRLGDPQHDIPAIHVAGTNGKGSTCAIIERLLREAGLRTGLNTSPHLVRFNERIRFNGKPIDDAQLAALAAELEALDPFDPVALADDGSNERADANRPCTFFELATALAYTAFAREPVDVSVIEVGLGGTHDATNVITPLLSVITPVSIDHTEFLGEDLAGIAAEKAGIIKPGRTVVTTHQDPIAADVIKTTTADQEAGPLHFAPEEVRIIDMPKPNGSMLQQLLFTDGFLTAPFHFPLRGAYQRQNLVTAAVAARLALKELDRPLSPESWATALAKVSWYGRFHRLHFGFGPPIFIDGAHNPAGASALLETLDQDFPDRPIAWIVGCLRDKKLHEILTIWSPRMETGNRVYAVPINHHRGMTSQELALALPNTEVLELPDALEAARSWAAENDAIVMIAGSLYLLGQVLRECR